MKMKQENKIAILGGGGRTGKYIVTQLLSQGYSLKVLLRNPENFQLESPFIEIVTGDAIDPNTIRSLVQGCQAVISTVGQRKDEPLVASQATLNILNAMTEYGIERYILVAGINVDTPFDKKGPETSAATEWMKMTFPSIHADRQKTYSILSTSNANWTLVRVPFIEFTDTKGETLVSLEDCRGNKISAGDIATFVIEQLSNDTYSRKSPFIANV
ncbi:MAG: NAD(P)H-binding protein [Cyclobacteriaceae bacterium]